MRMTALHVVLGASGGIGSAVVRELAGRGLSVRAVSRHGSDAIPRVHHEALDVSIQDAAIAACDGAATVYHCVQPPYHRWAAELPRLNQVIAVAAAQAGAKLVLADNLYMYGPIDGVIRETSQQRPSSAKGRTRKDAADALLQEHAAGRLRITIGRAADYFGPRGTNSIAGETVFGAAVAGRAARWPANADAQHSFTYLPDLARALVTLGESDAADGSAWILPPAPPLTARALVALIEQELGRKVELRVTGKLAMRLAGIRIRQARELPDIWYQFSAPFVAEASAFEAAFGAFATTTLDEAVRETIAWFRSRSGSGRIPSGSPREP
jgi:nucleoside-diphosphate-sugar epimerase